MTLTQIKEQIKLFGSKKLSYMKDYITKKEELTKKVSGLQMYQSEADQRLADYKLEVANYSRQTTDKLHADIEAAYEKELAALRAMEEGVTADDVAELTLLEGMTITGSDLEGYYEKYKHKPLAIKKLGQIVNKKVMEDPSVAIGFTPLDLVEELQNLVQTFKRDVNYIHGGFLLADDPVTLAQAEMVQYGTEQNLDRRLADYLENRK